MPTRNALSSAAVWNPSPGAHFVDDSRIREPSGRNGQFLWIGVCSSCLLIMAFWSFDEFAVEEGGSGADQRHQLGRVQGTPAGLC